MREILFRGKRIDNGEWVEGDRFEAGNPRDLHIYIMQGYASVFLHYADGRSEAKLCCHEIDNDTIGQYTGLKDKNGKRIFEGDIVKEDAYSIGRIYIDEDSCELRIKYSDKRLFKEKKIAKVNSYHLYEVIGNIYDNPELLND